MRRTRPHTPWFGRPLVAIALMAFTLLASCSDDSAAPDTIAPLPTTSVSDTVGTDTTLAATTTVPRPFTDDPPVQLSADGPWQRVASAPGITKPGLTYLLMPGVWVYLPVEENLDLGITWVLNDDDLPIIEAYLMARLTYFTATSTDPMDLDSPTWAEWYTDGGAQFMVQLRERRAQGQVGSAGDGVVLQPQVLGEERTESVAIVADCWLDGGYFLMPNGDLAPGSSRGIAEYGSAARLVLKGHWMTEQLGRQPDACA